MLLTASFCSNYRFGESNVFNERLNCSVACTSGIGCVAEQESTRKLSVCTAVKNIDFDGVYSSHQDNMCCNEYPLKCHFYMVKLGYTGV